MIALDSTLGPKVDDVLIQTLGRWSVETVTKIQTLALEAGVAAGESMVVCAPTSSGKTLVGEIALLQAMRSNIRSLYLVSHKALADQKYSDFVRRFSYLDSEVYASVAISTGDREEGHIQSDVLVTTYEKAAVLELAGVLDSENTVIVADELQIIGDETRGPNIEILCAILHQKGFRQFIGLTATIGNAMDIASWLNCKLVQSDSRDVALQQEIWYRGRGFGIGFGDERGVPLDPESGYPSDTMGAIRHLVDSGRAPVLVFTESRKEAYSHAKQYSRERQREATGIGLSEQLDLFSEPSEASDQLKSSVERRVAFHTADLSSQERRVIEGAFQDEGIDVCFATSTLAAGVNFPFKTILFPKLTYQYGDRSGNCISRSDYRNMSGRAGRLGMHETGFAVLLPQNEGENRYANQIVMPENDRIYSQLPTLSLRKAVLMLIAGGVVSSQGGLSEFLSHTYMWYLLRDKNEQKLAETEEAAGVAVEWLSNHGFVEIDNSSLYVTQLGKATARSGLLPSTVNEFYTLLRKHIDEFENEFKHIECGLLAWICQCDEFVGPSSNRFLPFSLGNPPGSPAYVNNHRQLVNVDRANRQLIQSVHALHLFACGQDERRIFRFTGISSGNVQRLASEVAWILDGLNLVAGIPSSDCSQLVGNKISSFATQVRWGAPPEAVDLIRLARYADVPGFGRQRAIALVERGFTTPREVVEAGVDRVEKVVDNRHRAEALCRALQDGLAQHVDHMDVQRKEVTSELDLSELITSCDCAKGTEYEDAILELLRQEPGWTVTKYDKGKRQNVPDLLLEEGGRSVFIECKTSSKSSGLIDKEGAFAVLQKAVDCDPDIACVTLGKVHFDELSKFKATGSTKITLIEHKVFIDGVLSVLRKQASPSEFLRWLTEPGVSELARLQRQ